MRCRMRRRHGHVPFALVMLGLIQLGCAPTGSNSGNSAGGKNDGEGDVAGQVVQAHAGNAVEVGGKPGPIELRWTDGGVVVESLTVHGGVVIVLPPALLAAADGTVVELRRGEELVRAVQMERIPVDGLPGSHFLQWIDALVEATSTIEPPSEPALLKAHTAAKDALSGVNTSFAELVGQVRQANVAIGTLPDGGAIVIDSESLRGLDAWCLGVQEPVLWLDQHDRGGLTKSEALVGALLTFAAVEAGATMIVAAAAVAGAYAAGTMLLALVPAALGLEIAATASPDAGGDADVVMFREAFGDIADKAKDAIRTLRDWLQTGPLSETAEAASDATDEVVAAAAETCTPECPTGTTCSFTRCYDNPKPGDACTPECNIATETCVNHVCVPKPGCTPECNITTEICVNHECVPKPGCIPVCNTTTETCEGHTCVPLPGVCTPKCPDFQHCQDGACMPNTGNLICSAVFECALSCVPGDTVCGKDCLAQGTGEAQARFAALIDCTSGPEPMHDFKVAYATDSCPLEFQSCGVGTGAMSCSGAYGCMVGCDHNAVGGAFPCMQRCYWQASAFAQLQLHVMYDCALFSTCAHDNVSVFGKYPETCVSQACKSEFESCGLPVTTD